ncbi:MAG: replicative DNA helicase [Anaerolineales bacterium]|jgi:replicative DNA helicase|nr:replicative DNA helicase [Anaerolineales bacterium]
MSTETNLIPHSRQAEEAVIGAVLINPDVYIELSEFLAAEDFYIHRLRFIWQAFARLVERRIPIDILTVSESLSQSGQLEEIGGDAALTGLLNATPTSLHADAYGQLVREAAVRRQMLTAANRIASLAHDQAIELPCATEQSVAALEGAILRESGGQLLALSDALSQAYDQIDALSRISELPGTPSGLIDLDRRLGNFQPGALYVLAARPGLGKTSLALTIACNAAQAGKRTAVFSLEMPTLRITNRLLAQESGLDVQLLDTGKVGEADWPRLTAAIEALEHLPLFIDDTPAITPLQLKSKLRRLHLSAGKPDLVIVDYLQLMRAGAKTENRTQEVGYISRSLKALSKELSVAIIAAAQLNREVEKRASSRPQLSDLRESGDIEADADVVMFLHKPDETAMNGLQPMELSIAKHRNGPTGNIPCLFRKTTTKFESALTRTVELN